MQGCRPAASRRGFGALEISDRLLSDRFADVEGCRAAAEDSEPSFCRNGTNTLLLAGSFTNPFSYRAAGNRTSCRRNPVGRGVIPNVIVIFVTMKQAVTPLRLGSDRISSLLVRYAIPSIIAMTSSSLYNIVDSIFIGHGVGPIAISGVALSMPLMNIASAFGSLIGIGAAALTSIRLGQGRREAAEGVLGNVVLLNFLVAALFTAVGLLLLDPILCFFGASDATIGYARDFMQIILGGTIVTHMYLSLNEVIRASGYPRRAMTIMLTAVVLNCLLNPLFIFGFGWGIRGSAAATVLAQAAALSVSLIHFSSRGSFIRFERGIFRLQVSVVGKIFSIGMASFLLHLCASAVVIVVNKSLREYGGDVAIGAYGIIYRVAMLFLMIVSGLNQGMQPIVGYNYGARAVRPGVEGPAADRRVCGLRDDDGIPAGTALSPAGGDALRRCCGRSCGRADDLYGGRGAADRVVRFPDRRIPDRDLQFFPIYRQAAQGDFPLPHAADAVPHPAAPCFAAASRYAGCLDVDADCRRYGLSAGRRAALLPGS